MGATVHVCTNACLYKCTRIYGLEKDVSVTKYECMSSTCMYIHKCTHICGLEKDVTMTKYACVSSMRSVCRHKFDRMSKGIWVHTHLHA